MNFTHLRVNLWFLLLIWQISSDSPREDVHQAAPREASAPFVNKQVLGGVTYMLLKETEYLDSQLLAPAR